MYKNYVKNIEKVGYFHECLLCSIFLILCIVLAEIEFVVYKNTLLIECYFECNIK